MACGGAQNHRIGLFDQVLIKENHIAAAGSLSAAITAARRVAGARKVEVEVETLAEFEEALRGAPDIILLDEFSLADMRTAVELNRTKGLAGREGRPVKLEASGSMTLETVRPVAETGVDYISIGGITKHVRAVDLSMRLEFAEDPTAEDSLAPGVRAASPCLGQRRANRTRRLGTSAPAGAAPHRSPARNPRPGWSASE